MAAVRGDAGTGEAESTISLTIEAVKQLYHGAPGSEEQQQANAFLLRLEQSKEAAVVATSLLRALEPARQAANWANGQLHEELVFFATQLLLSKVRHSWTSFERQEKIKLFEQVVESYDSLTRGSIKSTDKKTEPNLVLERLALLLAAIAVRSINSSDLLQRAVGMFGQATLERTFGFLKYMVEELEMCWMQLSREDRVATFKLALDMRKYTLDLLSNIVREMQSGVHPRVRIAAIACLQSWTTCALIHQVDSNVDIDNHLVHVGIGFDLLMNRGITMGDNSQTSLVEWICHEFSTADPETQLFQSCFGIIVDSLSFQKFESLDTSTKESLIQYKIAIESIASCVIAKFHTVQTWLQNRTREGLSSTPDEDLEADSILLLWRSICLIAAAICSDHLKCILLFCREDTLELLRILLFGVQHPADSVTTEACFDFWDKSGDSLFSSFVYFQKLKSSPLARDPEVSSSLSHVPVILTSAGLQDLFQALINAYVVCTVFCLKVKLESSSNHIAGINESASLDGESSFTLANYNRLFSRVYDSLFDLCSRWPEFVEANVERDGVSLRVSEKLVEGNILRALMVLQEKLRITITAGKSKEDILQVQAIVDLLPAVLEAGASFSPIDDSDDDDDDDDDDDYDDDGDELDLSDGRDENLDEADDDEVLGRVDSREDEDHTNRGGLDATSMEGTFSSLDMDHSFMHLPMRGLHRKRTSSLVAAHSEKDGAVMVAELAQLWCSITNDLLEGCWRVQDVFLRQSLCRFFGSVMDWIHTSSHCTPPSLDEYRTMANIGFNHESATICNPIKVFSKVVGFMLSSIVILREDTCTTAAAQFSLLCGKAIKSQIFLTYFTSIPIPISSFDTSGRLLSEEIVEVVGMDGILSLTETSQFTDAFRASGSAFAWCSEGITKVGLRLLLSANNRSGNGASQQTNYMNGAPEAGPRTLDLLTGFLNRILRSISRSISRVKNAKEYSMSVKEARQIIVNQLEALTHILAGLGCTHGCRRQAKKLVPRAVLHFVESIWSDLQSISLELVLKHQFTEVLDALCGTLVQLCEILRYHITTFAEDIFSHMERCFEATFDHSCLRVLTNILGYSKRIPKEPIESMISRITWLLVRPTTVNQAEFILQGASFGLVLNSEIRNPEVTKGFFKLLRAVIFDMPESFAKVRFPLSENSQPSSTLLEVTLGAATQCLSHIVGGAKATSSICSFLTSALSQERFANVHFIASLERCKPFIIEGCVDYLASSTSSSSHNIRSNQLIKVIKAILQPVKKKRQSNNSISVFPAAKVLTDVLSTPRYSHLSSRTKEAVCFALLCGRLDEPSLKARISDTSLLLCGAMQPVAGFDYSVFAHCEPGQVYPSPVHGRASESFGNQGEDEIVDILG